MRIDTVKWSDKAEVAAFVEQALQKKDEYCTVQDRQNQLNRAWYRGYQNLQLDEKSGALVPIRKRDKRNVRLIYNTILPDVEAYVANLGAEAINYEVDPEDDDAECVDAAKEDTELLQHLYAQNEMDETVEDSDRESVLTGETLGKVCWNPDAGEEFDFIEAAGVKDDDEYEKVVGGKPPKSLGAVEVHSVPASDVFWGPAGCKFKDKEWLIHNYERSVSEVAARYGVDPDELVNDGDRRYTVFRATDISPSGLRASHEESGERVTVTELWVKKGVKGSPQGRFAITCGTTVLKNGPNPYKHGRIPYEFHRLLFIPGHNRGFSPVDCLISPQSDFNRNMSQQVQVRQTMSNPRIMAKIGSIPNENEITGEAGGINYYIGDTPPAVWQGAGSPSSVFVNLDKTRRCAQDIIGIRDVSSAKVPTGAKSGRAIMALQQADRDRFGLISKRRRAFWRRIGELIISTQDQFAVEARSIAVYRENKMVRTRQYTGSGKGRIPHVRVSTSGMPRDKMAQLELAGTLMDRGALNMQNPDDKRTLFRILELGGLDQSLDPKQQHRDQARRENDQLLEGAMVPVSEGDDFDVHIQEHEALETKAFFRALPPEVQAPLRAHKLEHIRTRFYIQFRMEAIGKQEMARVSAEYPDPAQMMQRPGGPAAPNPNLALETTAPSPVNSAPQ